MSTMFDVPMHDFSGDGSMDTDMLPSAPDVDWLQVENMIEDDVSKEVVVGEEVEMMIHETETETETEAVVVQEFEMVDTGDGDGDVDISPEYNIDNASAAAVAATVDHNNNNPGMAHDSLEVLDQEIQDASRATSPTPVVQSIIEHDDRDPQTVDVSIIPGIEEEEPQRGVDDSNENVYAAHHHSYDESGGSVHGSTIAYTEQLDHNAHDAQDQHVPQEQEQEQTAVDYAYVEISDTAVQEHDLQHLEHTGGHDQESFGHDETAVPTPQVPAEVPLPDEVRNEGDNLEVLQESQRGASPSVVQHQQDLTSEQGEGVTLEDAEQHTSSVPEPQPNKPLEEQYDHGVSGSHSVGEETKHDDEEEEPFVEPPPCVLLTYLFDGSKYCLFQSFEKAHITGPSSEIVPSKAPELGPSPNSKPSSNKTTESKNVQSEMHPTMLLFAEQPDLFYAPVSQLFDAIRSDLSVNIGGRFDENVELVITAVGLDLRLPEDNIHSREVSLNDLSVLHTGCELTGLLSLQLDTIAPRFGTRYKAIRDALVSIVSTADHHEHHEQVPYVDGQEGQEDTDAHRSTVQEEPAVPVSPPQIIHGQTYEEAIDVKNADTVDKEKEVTDSRDATKAEDGREGGGEDEEAEAEDDDFENQDKNENEGIGHVDPPPSAVAEPYAEPDGVQDEYYDEDAEGEYEEEGQSYDGIHGDIDASYYSENQEENTLTLTTLEENPHVEENDIEDQESETIGSAEEDHQYLPEEAIQDGLTPEQNSSESAEGSLYEPLANEDGVDANAAQNEDVPPTQNSIPQRVFSSKRSFDEHETGQYDDDGASASSTGETTQKRSRLN